MPSYRPTIPNMKPPADGLLSYSPQSIPQAGAEPGTQDSHEACGTRVSLRSGHGPGLDRRIRRGDSRIADDGSLQADRREPANHLEVAQRRGQAAEPAESRADLGLAVHKRQPARQR